MNDFNRLSQMETLPLSNLFISRFNTRKTRDSEKVAKLSERMVRNGFEVTRALWVYPVEDGYEVFAGGTRLEAAERAGLDVVPCLIHSDLSEDAIVRLSIQDNEDDEYHTKVPVIDLWAEYARLHKEEGWTQQRIADAMGVSRQSVVMRIRYDSLPIEVKTMVSDNILTEGHLEAISGICPTSDISDWLTPDRITLELAQKIAHDAGKNGAKSVKATRDDAKQWKDFISVAEDIYSSLPAEIQLFSHADKGMPQHELFDAKAAFLDQLIKRRARSLAAVKEAEHVVQGRLRNAEKAYLDFLEGKANADVANEAKRQHEAQIIDSFRLGGFSEVLTEVISSGRLENSSIKLLITDPPFGKDYQSNRRWQSKAPAKIANDQSQLAAYAAVAEMLELTKPLMAEDAHVLMKADWDCVGWMRDLLEDNGYTLKRPIIWIKEEHSAGDVNHSFANSHEIILHAIKGKPLVRPRIRDVIEARRTRETTHPMETPVELWQKLINSATNEGDLILDPFSGTASSLLAAKSLSRRFFGIEKDEAYRNEGLGRLL